MEREKQIYAVRWNVRLLFSMVEILWKNHARFIGLMVATIRNRDGHEY